MNTFEINQPKRIDWIDFAKGITILLTILGHTVYEYYWGNKIRGVIFSFHMPLFFILSILTLKLSTSIEEWKTKVKRDIKHLIFPAICLFIVSIIAEIAVDSSIVINSEYWLFKVYSLIYASGIDQLYYLSTIPALGMSWFLIVLFTVRATFDYLHLQYQENNKLLIWCLTFGLIGYSLGITKNYLPFSLDISLAIMPFIFFGYRMKEIDFSLNPLKKGIIWLLIWALCWYITYPGVEIWTYLELSSRRYSLYPISFICGIAGTMSICYLSSIICQNKTLVKPIVLLGKNSLILYCIHIIDYLWENIWLVENHQFDTALRRIICDLIIFAIILLVKKFIKKQGR